MGLPAKVIDRLFERLAATYGRQFSLQWDGLPVGDVKSAWGHELSGFAGNLVALAWALENLPERMPNAIEFRNLARRAPAPIVPALPEPPANPERVRQELSRLGGLRESVTQAIASRSSLMWAHVIITKAEQGRINPTVHRFARQALRLEA